MIASYEYDCPNCGETYCRDFEIDKEIDENDIVCEDCGHEFHVYAGIEIVVTVS